MRKLSIFQDGKFQKPPKGPFNRQMLKNKFNTDLDLVLTGKWYDMIEAGIKTEEYRSLNKLYFSRLIKKPKDIKNIGFLLRQNGFFGDINECLKIRYKTGVASPGYRIYKTVTFRHGYGKRSRRMTFEVLGIQVKEGKPEWGAEPGVKYFTISLGKKLSDGFGCSPDPYEPVMYYD